jgi:hypothetical protein
LCESAVQFLMGGIGFNLVFVRESIEHGTRQSEQSGKNSEDI